MKVVQVEGGVPGVEHAEGVYGKIVHISHSIAVWFIADMSNCLLLKTS